MLVSDELYTKLDKKYCSNWSYGSFSTIQSAKDACSADSNCQGVYDQRCDADPYNIYLCPYSVKLYSSSMRSCVFQKNEKGKYSKSFYLKKTCPLICNLALIMALLEYYPL